MSPESFQYLLNVVGPFIAKKDTSFRKSIQQPKGFVLLYIILLMVEANNR